MKLPLWRIAEFVGTKSQGEPDAVAMGYSIDSRTLNPGDLFIAIAGERYDGHNYVEAALEKGAVGAIVHADKTVNADPHRLLQVEDSIKALQALGAAARRLWGKPLLAVTGSAGKTTTKEILAHILSTRFRVMKSSGNLNNHIGLPLQLLKLEAEHDLAVVEMGMNHAGEIRALGALAHHDLAVVTSVAPVHLEFFNSLAEIARAKYEIIETLPSGGVAVLNADDDYVCQFGRDFKGKVVTFGIKRAADVSAQKIRLNGAEGSTFELVAGSVREPVNFPLVGEHNVSNALAAAAAAMERGVTPSQAAVALSSIQPPEKRGQVLEIGGTYYRPKFRGTGFNRRVKEMLLKRAFECGMRRVEFRVDIRNRRSQAAMKKLGAVREGVLRADRITWTGHVRDTVLFAILRDEWPV